MTEGLWTIADLKHYHRTGEEPDAVAAKKKPKATRRTQPKRSDEAPLSIAAAHAIYEVKAALALDALKVADVAWAVYDALLAEEQRAEGGGGLDEKG